MPDNVAFLFAACVVTALLIFGYCVFINGRIGGLRQDVELLREELATRAAENATRAPGGDAAGAPRG